MSKTFFYFIITLFFIAGLFVTIFTTITIVSTVKNLPSPEQLNNRKVNQSTKIFDRTGTTQLYEVHGTEKRTVVPLEDIPLFARQATLAAEDAHFYENPAFDIQGIFRALIANLQSGSLGQGGSTITQQLAKNVFLTREKTLTRKLKELVIAIQFESRYSKDQILWYYLNQIPYGSNAYGIEAATQTFFGKPVKNINLSEAATLAALLNAPSYYSPWGSHINDLLTRKNYVLERMAELNMITPAERDEAKKASVVFSEQSLGAIIAPHFVLSVRDSLIERYGEDVVTNGGLRVITTLDTKLQSIAERVVLEGAMRNNELYKGSNAALVAEDAKTGHILALVGSRNYFDDEIDGNFNVPTQGLRQPGSALKPFIYLTAFQKGYQPNTVVFDVETEFDASGIPGHSYKPENYDETYPGPVKLSESLAQSRNVPAVKALYLAGIDATLKNLDLLGIKTLTERGRYGLSLVLGGGEVKLTEMVGAYSALATEGVYHKQTNILEIRDSKGNVLESYSDSATRVIDPIYPRLINSILSDKSLRAPLFQNSLGLTIFPGYDVALKTGTTNDYRDAWTVGYSPSLAAGVWAGNNDNTPMQKRGGSILAALPIWSAFMKEALPSFSQESFNEPDALTEINKPMLNGTAYTTYVAGTNTYPQAHSILYYADRSDPLGPIPQNPNDDSQFENWEKGIADWVRTHLPNGGSYNQPLPPDAVLSTTSSTPSSVTPTPPQNTAPTPAITDLEPRSGTAVSGIFTIRGKTSSKAGLKRVEVFFNGKIIGEQSLNGNEASFSFPVNETLRSQNVAEVRIFDVYNQETRAPILVFQQ